MACLALAGIAIAATSFTPRQTELTKAISVTNVEATTASAPAPLPAPAPAAVSTIDASETAVLYDELHLEEAGMKPEVFETAVKGFSKILAEGKCSNDDKLTIIDFSQPSTQKRLYVVDLESKKILFQSLVSHGRNTGSLWARTFSNQPESFMSSPGFYVTAETYMGGNGYSLRLDGLEKNINHNARARAIVMHGAPYSSPSTINTLGFLGRSQGCPALPLSIHKSVINTIKNGTCLFIYTADKWYTDRSQLIG